MLKLSLDLIVRIDLAGAAQCSTLAEGTIDVITAVVENALHVTTKRSPTKAKRAMHHHRPKTAQRSQLPAVVIE